MKNASVMLKDLYSTQSSFNIYTTLVNAQRSISPEYISFVEQVLEKYNSDAVRVRWLRDEHELDYQGRVRRRGNGNVSGSAKQTFFMLDAVDSLFEHFSEVLLGGYRDFMFNRSLIANGY